VLALCKLSGVYDKKYTDVALANMAISCSGYLEKNGAYGHHKNLKIASKKISFLWLKWISSFSR